MEWTVNDNPWMVTFVISRKKGEKAQHFQPFQIEVDPDEYVLDGIERIWANHDRSLTFRHACHHSTCGACGMLVNGVEKLTCITTIRSVTHDGGTLKVEPLRNFPVAGDLVVDMSDFYVNMDSAKAKQVVPLAKAALAFEKEAGQTDQPYDRLVDCIECGMCISACPIALTTSSYLGPAVLAGVQQTMFCGEGDESLLQLADQKNGVWRCHSAYECTAVCPSHVDPGWRIMDLRKRVIGTQIARMFKPGNKETSSNE